MLQIVLKETDLTSSPLTRNLTVMSFVGTDATMDKLPVLVQVVKSRKRNVLSYILMKIYFTTLTGSRIIYLLKVKNILMFNYFGVRQTSNDNNCIHSNLRPMITSVSRCDYLHVGDMML